ncbi:iron ABC transporter permease [Capnocytophaga leadbetteri]|uniref:FecCD family ABC transporter permease n=1 Tax=Capnocytophaga leadbetteri TaxID=327575 RepID=UPI0026ED0C26|nr:iron ABC transporter permease [Capnocytophaga leadbetteri]
MKINKHNMWLIGLLIGLIVLCLLSLSVGRYPLPIRDILAFVFGQKVVDEHTALLLTDVRLPRVAAALLVGGALSVSGVAYQGMFKNPLISPDILGVSSGAGFGAALAILLSWSMLGIQLSAFAFGLAAVLIALALSKRISGVHSQALVLLLSGIITGAMFGAFISLTKYIADAEYKLPDITFWLMGSLTNVTATQVLTIAPIVLLAVLPLYFSSWRLNVLSFGEDEAHTMGVQVQRLRLVVILSATLLTATVVSITGLIGWIGLVVPHIARFIIGSDNRYLLPTAFMLGSSFLIVIDLLSRTLSALEIPLGIIASIIGAPIFFFVLKSVKSKQSVWE